MQVFAGESWETVGEFQLERVMHSPLIPQPLLPRKRGEGRLAEAKRRKQGEGQSQHQST